MTGNRVEDSLLPEVLDGRYRLTTSFETQSFGVAYFAEDLDHREMVEVMLLPEKLVASTSLHERFVAHAESLLELSHPSVVIPKSYGISGKVPYFVFSPLSGESLESLSAVIKPSVEWVIAIARHLLRALEFGHEQGFLHLDVQPSNVFCIEEGGGSSRPVLRGLGIASLLLEEERKQGPLKTINGVVIGNPEYIPPEQILGEPVDLRTDLYAVGALLYKMITGKTPFDGNVAQQWHQHCYSPPPRIAGRCPELKASPELDVFFERALNKAPPSRFQSASEMLDILESFKPALAEILPTYLPTRTASEVGTHQSVADGGPESDSVWYRNIVYTLIFVVFFIVAFFGTMFLFRNPFRRDSRGDVNEAPFSEQTEPPGDPSVETSRSGEIQDASSAELDGSMGADAPASLPVKSPTKVSGIWDDEGIPHLYLQAKKQLDAGQMLDSKTVKALRRVAMESDDDPRPFLLLARHRIFIGHYSDALDHYELAVKADRRVRHEPSVLPHLIKMVTTGMREHQAMMMIRRIYGYEAVGALDEALRSPNLRPEERRRLRTCRRMVDVLSDRRRD